MAGGIVLPMRGQVWDVHFPAPVGAHPAVVMAANVLRPRLSSVTVVLVTGTQGPAETHVEFDVDAGVTRDGVSNANATDLHTVPLRRFRRRRSPGHCAEGHAHRP